MTKKSYSKNWLLWGKGIMAGLLLAGSLQMPALADSALRDEVRVAMYLDLGSTYKSTAPAVTLQAGSPWRVGTEAVGTWLQFESGQSVRFSVDGYKVKALESADWNTVAAAVKVLQGTADKPVAFVQNNLAGKLYEVYTGPYATASEAQTAATRVATSIASYLKGQSPAVQGSFYAAGGAFATEGEAEAVRSSIGSNAAVAMTAPGQYAVWVGGAANEVEASTVQAALSQSYPQVSWQVESGLAPTVLLLRQDVTLNLDSPSPVKHIQVAGSDPRVTIQDSDDSLIQVSERNGRSYRGSFEVSRYNGVLALVNQVPMDQYLYSVVAAEVPSSWPQESLKAQAVAARSYALYNANLNKFKIAGLVDTTLSQVYNGAEKEVASLISAVDSTSGEVLMANGQVIEGLFSSNSGGITADPTEIWGNETPIYTAVTSSGDQSAESALFDWYYVLLNNGQTGYVREDNTAMTGTTTAAGLNKLTVTTSSVMVRKLPMIQSNVDPVAKLNPGDQAVILDKVSESSSYAWIRGPYSSEELLAALKGKTTTEVSGPIQSLEITQRGPSGRVIQVKANGQIIDVKYPDALRSALNGLPSTLFDIVPTGRYTVQSAGGAAQSATVSSDMKIQTASGLQAWSGGNLVVMNESQEARVLNQTQKFLFIGQGNGHGLGLSQWGAKGMADQGYDYRQILQHYYQNVTIDKR